MQARPSRFVAILGFLAIAGCGRKATEADCQLIIDRNVELQMKAMSITDPVAISKKQEELRKEMKDELHEDCLGRRITNAMMDCVKKASTPEEINQCVR